MNTPDNIQRIKDVPEWFPVVLRKGNTCAVCLNYMETGTSALRPPSDDKQRSLRIHWDCRHVVS
jgi:ferredoxin